LSCDRVHSDIHSTANLLIDYDAKCPRRGGAKSTACSISAILRNASCGVASSGRLRRCRSRPAGRCIRLLERGALADLSFALLAGVARHPHCPDSTSFLFRFDQSARLTHARVFAACRRQWFTDEVDKSVENDRSSHENHSGEGQ